jgi:endonuclease/exonuclease/phosphatase family metal-dependent hydrolase
MSLAHLGRTPLWAILAVSTLGLAACDGGPAGLEPTGLEIRSPEVAAAQAATQGEAFLRLYSRNVYLGADLAPLLALPDFSDVQAVAAAVTAVWGNVLATDFQSRAEAIVADIARTHPHVVGLYEMATYVVFAPQPDGSLQPTADGIDFVAVIQQELAESGLDYQLATLQPNTTTPVPFPFIGAQGLRFIDFTLNDVILVRSDVPVVEAVSDNYEAVFPLAPGFDLRRGWSRVSFPFEGTTHHVVATHLEVQLFRPVQDAQATELIEEVVADLDGPTFVMGDLNSDANNDPPAPSWTPTYGRLVDAGFVDSWLERAGRRDLGFTCCWDPDLTGGVLDERIDFILVRAPGAVIPGDGGNMLTGAVQLDIRGEAEADRTPVGGLFPSDHVGLFGAFNLPRGRVAARR